MAVSPIPRQADDQERIPNATSLLRLLKEDFVTRESDGSIRIRANAFLDGQFETSCFIDTPAVIQVLRHLFPGKYLARVSAGHVRNCAYGIAYATGPEDCNIDELREFHVVLFPPAGVTNNENKRRCDAIRKNAELILPPVT